MHDEKVLIHDVYHIKCMLHTVNYSCEILRNFAIKQNQPFRPQCSLGYVKQKKHGTWVHGFLKLKKKQCNYLTIQNQFGCG